MEINVNFGCYGNVFAIPSVIVDDYIKIVDGNTIKVLLYVLRNSGESIDTKEMIENVGISENDFAKALKFWSDLGILSAKDSPGKDENVAATSAVATKKRKKSLNPKLESTNNEETSEPEIFENSSSNSQKTDGIKCNNRKMRGLISTIESVLQRTLNENMNQNVKRMYEEVGLPAEVIVMLVHYCKQMDKIAKSNLNYVEKTALDWKNRGIVTLEKAEEEIAEYDRRKKKSGSKTPSYSIDTSNDFVLKI
ncbi:MAG: DnaD domain protein [Ruminococcus sp.]|jgi:DnaD/phage-associated family protein|nr:DnaD domain protein [Ruminococcus sp.]